MIELISKTVAINTTYNMCCRWDGEDRDDLRNMMLTAFQELSTIDPVKHGEWIVIPQRCENQTFDECKCSVCGTVEYFNSGWKKFSYCPNCGAKMESE